MSTIPTPALCQVPDLDPEFWPASLWIRNHQNLRAEHGSRAVEIHLLRPDGRGTRHTDSLLPADPEWTSLNRRHLERTIKFLIRGRGGSRVLLEGCPELCKDLQRCYAPGGDLIIEHANTVLHDEFPSHASSLHISTPDEKMKRHGQAIAAASLPDLP